MNDPLTEIPNYINLIAAASTPSSQLSHLHSAFTPNASFTHPLVYIPSTSSPPSRDRIAKIYQFYRAAIPETSFDIHSTVFDERSGLAYVQLVQRPWVRGLSWVTGWRPGVPMLVRLKLQRGDSTEGEDAAKWYIAEQEDFVQAVSLGMATGVPGVTCVVLWVYWVFALVAMAVGRVARGFGIWKPEEGRKVR